MPTNTYYVSGKVSTDGNFADCTYYLDREGTQPVGSDQLHIPKTAGSCVFEQADSTELLLVGASFKTIGQTPSMDINNFAPANSDNVVTVTMPTDKTVTKGVVLLFSTPGTVQNLYPTSDPQIINDHN